MEGIYETFRTWQTKKSVFSVAIKKTEAECKVARIQLKVHNRWKVSGDVFLRFNPNKFEKEIDVGRTVKAHPSAERGQLKKKSDFDGGLDHSNLEHLINALMRSPRVIEQSRRFSALRYKKDPIHATLFSDAIAY